MADQQDRPEPDHSKDPRGKEVGESGYPEEQPGDAGPPASGGGGGAGAGERTGDDEATERAPSTSSPSEGEPGEASGNPDAAGGS
jgi:hypothetical protein